MHGKNGLWKRCVLPSKFFRSQNAAGTHGNAVSNIHDHINLQNELLKRTSLTTGDMLPLCLNDRKSLRREIAKQPMVEHSKDA